MELGQRIKELRIKTGLTQLELANLISVSDRTISKWEQGRGNPDIETLPSLARVLDVSLDYLLTGKEYKPSLESKIEATILYFEKLIKQKITDEYCRRIIAKHVVKYGVDNTKDALDICYGTYLHKNNRPLVDEDIKNALMKLGGILYNKDSSPLENKIRHLVSYLAKNTDNPTDVLKTQCEDTIHRLLDLKAKKQSMKYKIELINRLIELCAKEKLDLNGFIAKARNQIKKLEDRSALKERIERGYLSFKRWIPVEINLIIEDINKCIRNNDGKSVAPLIVMLIDKMYRMVFKSLDPNLMDEQIPSINEYKTNIFNIIGELLGYRDYRITCDLIDKYLNYSEEKIIMDDINLLDELIKELIKISRIKSNEKYAYYNRDYLVNINA